LPDANVNYVANPQGCFYVSLCCRVICVVFEYTIMKCRSPLRFLLASTCKLHTHTHTHAHADTQTLTHIHTVTHIVLLILMNKYLFASLSLKFYTSLFDLFLLPLSPPPPFVALRPNSGHGLLILDHAQRRIIVGRTSLDEWSARRRDLYLTTHNTQHRHPCPGGIRTHNPSKRAAVDPRLRPRGHWDRHYHCIGKSCSFPRAKALIIWKPVCM